MPASEYVRIVRDLAAIGESGTPPGHVQETSRAITTQSSHLHMRLREQITLCGVCVCMILYACVCVCLQLQ